MSILEELYHGNIVPNQRLMLSSGMGMPILEVNRLSTQIDYDRTKAEILRLAEMKYACCTYSDAPQKTELLKSTLAEQPQLNTLDIGLLKSCVSQILVSHFCTIEVKFINGTVIKNLTERSIPHDHSIECQSDSCTTADG